MPHRDAHCQPVIRASYQTNQHTSEDAFRPWQEGGFHNIWCSGRERAGRRWGESVSSVLMLVWRFGINTTSCFLSRYRSVSGQSVVSACSLRHRLLTVMLMIFLLVTFVTALAHSLLLCLCPMLTSPVPLFPNPLSPSVHFCPSFSPVHRWEVTTAVRPWIQTSPPTGPLVAVAVKGPGLAPHSPMRVCSITYPTSNSRTTTTTTTISPPATPTARPTQLWVQHSSSLSVTRDVSLSSISCVALISKNSLSVLLIISNQSLSGAH